jgi:hypothetical protein
VAATLRVTPGETEEKKEKAMKRMMLIATVVVLAATSMTGAQSNPNTPVQAPLTGAFAVTLTPEEGGPPPFKVLMLFTRDGGVVETDAGPPNPQQFSPGIGEWTRDADGQYVIRYTQLQFDESQNLIGTFRGKITATFDESKKLVVGRVRVRFYDTNDAIEFEAEGRVEGTRLPLDD